MFGNKKLKERIEKLEKELASAKRDIKILWDVCEPQINAKLEQGMQEVVTALAKIFNVNVETAKKEKKEKSANIGKKEEEKQDIVADKETTQEIKPKKVDKNPIKYKDPYNSTLMSYYRNYNLNLEIRDFKPIRRLSEKEAAILLYLFDNYKYVDEIMKHIKLTKSSILTYAYILRSAGYLIFRKDMGRVADGCLIYKKGV